MLSDHLGGLPLPDGDHRAIAGLTAAQKLLGPIAQESAFDQFPEGRMIGTGRSGAV